MNIKRFLWVQKEGTLVGGVWGLISIFASLGLATTKPELSLIDKALILPTYLANLITPVEPSWPLLLIPVLIGIIIGMIVDMLYKPKE